MLAVRKAPDERLRVRAVCLGGVPISADTQSRQEASVVEIVQYKHPASLPLVTQSVVHELEYVGLWILPP